MRTAIDDRPVAFLDKDGTLIEDLPYNVDPARVRFAPAARDAVALWGEHGWRIAVITNQSGVARGYFTLDRLDTLADHLEREVRGLGAGWAGFYACPHHPDGINEYAIECDCRKPEPGLIRRAAAALEIDPAAAWFIGDTWMDVVAGRAAGCRTILVGPEWRLADGWAPERQPDHAVPDLLAAARICVADRARADGVPADPSRILSAAARGTIR
ncbi:MAG TPA: HAD family hydrolase [Candidatus Acidoferrum sp.]|nr:HAD family hydrolase [Candidatus Acidoferrum sp.]